MLRECACGGRCFLILLLQEPSQGSARARPEAGRRRLRFLAQLPPDTSVLPSVGAGVLPGPVRGRQQGPTAQHPALCLSSVPTTQEGHPRRLRGGHGACGLPAPCTASSSTKAAPRTRDNGSTDIRSRVRVHPCTEDSVAGRGVTR